MKTISIAMATYNGAKFITEQLDSLAKQTVLPNELVLTDDNSTDNTLEIVTSFAAKAPFPVRVKKNEKNLGYRANFMKAAGLSKGDLIAFCDQDDVWLPEKLETCRAAFENEDVLLAYHNATVVTERLEPVETLEKTAAPKAVNPPLSIEPRQYGLGFTQIFTRMLLDFDQHWPRSVDYNRPDKPEAHDQWYFFLASCLGTIVYLAEPLALYRRHDLNTTQYYDILPIHRKLIVLGSNNIDTIKAREISSAYRASVLEGAQVKLDSKFLARAAEAAAGYRKLEVSCHLRREMYASDNFFFRSNQILTVLQSGGYGPKNKWGSGHQAFLRDILRGVIFPMRVPLGN